MIGICTPTGVRDDRDRKMIQRACAALAFASVFAPRTTHACSVCFGQSDSPMAWGVNMGIFLMLGVTGAVLAAFASFFIYLIRRARLVERADRLQQVGTEGTASC